MAYISSINVWFPSDHLYHTMISEDQKSKKDNVVAISPLIDNFLIKRIFLPWLVLQMGGNQRENLLEINLEVDCYLLKK